MAGKKPSKPKGYKLAKSKVEITPTPVSARSFAVSMGDKEGNGDGPINTQTMAMQISEAMGLDNGLAKSVQAQTIKKDVDGKYDKSKVAFGSKLYNHHPDNLQYKGYQRLNDAELRQLALMDPYISAIITTRASQAGTTGNPSDSKFDKGVRITELKPLKPDDFNSKEEYQKEQRTREMQMEAILHWVLSCGTSDQDIINYAFNGAPDNTFKYCTFKEFLEAQVRNLLTFGRAGTQIFRNQDAMPVMFRPVPIETFAPLEHGEETWLTSGEEVADQSIQDMKDYNALDPNERPAAYVQRIDGKNDNFFTEDDLHLWYYQKQALFGLNGYPLAPIEMALFMAFIHQQTLGYLRNQFVKGMTTKGMIVLESTNENVQISDADLEDFKQQFHNYATRTDNSAVTPVIGGPIKAQFINLSPSPKDMEWLQVEEHVIRSLCSAFQISPQEMGYGHLSLPQGSLSSANKQEDIVKGEERGLRMLLDVVFDGVNAIVFENFPEAKKLYRVTYVGVGEDTRESVVSRGQQELNTTATLSGLYADSEKKETVPLGGAAPLAPSFNQFVVAKMKYGEYREFFFGEENASRNPAYDFIIDPNLNAAYQQLKVQPIKVQQEAAQMQMAQQEQQLQMGQAQMQQAQQGGQPGQEQQSGQPAPANSQEQPQQGGSEQSQEPMQESEDAPVKLMDKFKQLKSAEPLEKSVSSYFAEWNKAHE